MNHSQFIQNNYKLIVGFIISIALVLAVSSVWDDAPIVDEIPHIGAGYSYIAAGDHRLNPEHPPLAKDLAGIGVYLAGNNGSSFSTRYWRSDLNGQWEFGRHLLFSSGNDTLRMIRFSKSPQLIFFILSAIIIAVWTKRLYGNVASILALFLFSLSPTVLAHSRFVTTDIPALFGVLLSSFFFLDFIKDQKPKKLVYAGLAFGVAQLTKFSLFLLNPVFLVIAITYALIHASHGKKIQDSFKLLFKTILIIGIGYLVVWIVYIPHVINYPPELQKEHTTKLLETYGKRTLPDMVIYFSDKPVIRALAQYGLGFLMVVQRSIGGNTTYFLGEVSREAWKHYFPIVYFIKEPLAFWGLMAMVLSFFGIKINRSTFKAKTLIEWSKNHFTELAMFLWLAVYWYTSISANLNIGVRHLMPIYGFTYILLAGGLTHIGKNIKLKYFTGYLILCTSLLCWYMYENIKIYPYYLTYFNQTVGGAKNGYRYVVDSNIDWGQDLKRLSDWVEVNNVKNIYLDYFGWSDQSFYLKNNFIWLQSSRFRSKEDFLTENPNGGWVAISATFYMGLSKQEGLDYNWLKLEDRFTTIGNSIFVWYVSPQN